FSIVGNWKIDTTVILIDSTEEPIAKDTTIVGAESFANISDTGTVQLGIYLGGTDVFQGKVWSYEQVNDSLLVAKDTTQDPTLTMDIAIETLAKDSAIIIPNLTPILGPGHAAIVTIRR